MEVNKTPQIQPGGSQHFDVYTLSQTNTDMPTHAVLAYIHAH